MATVNHPVVKPYVLKTANVKFKLSGATDTDDFTPHISEIRLTPSTPSGSWTGVSGNVISDQGVATWTAQFGAIQDLDTAGLLRWLLANQGKKADVTAILATGAGTITCTVTLAAGEIGGAVGADPLTFTTPMAVDGTPAWV
jgi:hypothetical protein